MLVVGHAHAAMHADAPHTAWLNARDGHKAADRRLVQPKAVAVASHASMPSGGQFDGDLHHIQVVLTQQVTASAELMLV